MCVEYLLCSWADTCRLVGIQVQSVMQGWRWALWADPTEFLISGVHCVERSEVWSQASLFWQAALPRFPEMWLALFSRAERPQTVTWFRHRLLARPLGRRIISSSPELVLSENFWCDSQALLFERCEALKHHFKRIENSKEGDWAECWLQPFCGFVLRLRGGFLHLRVFSERRIFQLPSSLH